jgi:hypothetical protein
MELQTKFIEGTNEQYSIREDGAIISHYRIRYNALYKRYYTITKDIEKKLAEYRCNILVNGVNKSFSCVQLVYDYFGFFECKTCKSRTAHSCKRICKECSIKNKKNYRKLHPVNPINQKVNNKKYRLNNPEKVKEAAKKAGMLSSLNITRNHVAQCLNLTVGELTDELYNHHKNVLIFKRQVAKENNINIEKLV